MIPSWNGRELLDTALLALAATRRRYGDHAALVVDNGSTDGTAARLQPAQPGVESSRWPGTAGSTPAVNGGVGPARDAEYVALLNNDMELDPGWLGALVAALDADPGAGAAASKLRMLREPGRVRRRRGHRHVVRRDRRRGNGELDRGQYDEGGGVVSACAGAALYRPRALEQVGGFDEAFFAYLEDADWGLRAQLRGLAPPLGAEALAIISAGRRPGGRPTGRAS